MNESARTIRTRNPLRLTGVTNGENPRHLHDRTIEDIHLHVSQDNWYLYHQRMESSNLPSLHNAQGCRPRRVLDLTVDDHHISSIKGPLALLGFATRFNSARVISDDYYKKEQVPLSRPKPLPSGLGFESVTLFWRSRPGRFSRVCGLLASKYTHPHCHPSRGQECIHDRPVTKPSTGR